MTNKETEVFSDTINVSKTGVFLNRLSTSLLMLLSGIFLLFLVGFAQGPGGFLHDAAHDTRHAVTFPCH